MEVLDTNRDDMWLVRKQDDKEMVRGHSGGVSVLLHSGEGYVLARKVSIKHNTVKPVFKTT